MGLGITNPHENVSNIDNYLLSYNVDIKQGPIYIGHYIALSIVPSWGEYLLSLLGPEVYI